MIQKITRISGWALTILLALLFTMSAFLKLTQNEAAVAQAASIGIDAATYQLIGVVEILALVLFLVPRTGIVGGLLLIAYMGGAIATHVQHHQPLAMAVGIQVLVWVAVALRFPELLQRLAPRLSSTLVEKP